MKQQDMMQGKKNLKERKVIGIIGGMGPLATCDLYRKIIEETDAERDQDHLRVLMDSNTNIPDRTAAILSGGESPIPALTESAGKLESIGADLLVIPCNTAHYFHREVQASVRIPVLHMLRETAAVLRREGRQCVGLLATDGTIQTGLYQRELEAVGIEAMVPDEAGQRAVMELIYQGVKAGNLSLDLTGFYRAATTLIRQGAETLVLGCTELPVAFSEFQIDLPAIDPTRVLARAAVQAAGGKLRA